MLTQNSNSYFLQSKFCICVRIYSRIPTFRCGLFASRGTARSRLELDPPGSSSQETQPETETLAGSATLKYRNTLAETHARNWKTQRSGKLTNKQTNTNLKALINKKPRNCRVTVGTREGGRVLITESRESQLGMAAAAGANFVSQWAGGAGGGAGAGQPRHDDQCRHLRVQPQGPHRPRGLRRGLQGPAEIGEFNFQSFSSLSLSMLSGEGV